MTVGTAVVFFYMLYCGVHKIVFVLRLLIGLHCRNGTKVDDS